MSFAVINTAAYMTEEALSFLEENGCRVIDRELAGLREDEFCREIGGIDAVIADGERYSEKIFEAADRLKIVARTGAGYDRVNTVAASKHGIWVTTTPGATSNGMADFTLGLILCLLRNIPAMAQEMKEGVWKGFVGRDLASMTLGIVGAGSIGREVIKRAKAFGADILAHDIQADNQFAREWGVTYVSLDELMAKADIVSLHVSLNEETRGLIDQTRLKLMKRESYLVNTSRPTVVDKEALIKALAEKKIAGAAIDVHEPEPVSPDDPLVLLDNVIATPWTAYNTKEGSARMCITAARDVVTVLQGGVPKFPVNKLEGS